MKRITLLLVIVALFLGCKPENKGIAKVAGKKITQGEFDTELERYKKVAVPADYELTEDESMMLKSQVLNTMIQKRMFEKKLDKLEIVADPTKVEEMLKQIESQYGSKEDMIKDVEAKGFTMEELTDEFTYRTRLNMLSEYIDNLESTATDEELMEFYNEKKESHFTDYGTITASHILINLDNGEEEALKKALEVKEEIAGGLDFAEAAKKHSQGPSGANGGSLPPFQKGQMVEEFFNSAATTPLNTVSEPVLTQYGYHLVLVTDRSEPTVADFEETKEFIKAQVKQEKFLDEVESEAKITKPEWAESK